MQCRVHTSLRRLLNCWRILYGDESKHPLSLSWSVCSANIVGKAFLFATSEGNAMVHQS